MRTRVSSLLALVALVLTIGPVVNVAAFQADTATPSAVGEFPQLEITIADSAPTLPEEIEAGRYRVVVDTQAEAMGSVDFIYVPEDVTMEQLMADASGEGPPEWYYSTTIPGGVRFAPGATNEVILDLVPGQLLVFVSIWEGDANPGEPQLVTVTGDASSIDNAPVPDAAVDLLLLDFAFELSDTVPAGTNTWRITNDGQQPHEVSLVKAPDGVTVEQVVALSEADMTGGTPPPDSPNPEDFVPVGSVATISTGQTVWSTFDLEPGTYVMLCYITDPETGLPHLMIGMVDVFTVD